MARRQRLSDRPHPYGWVEEHECRINGRTVTVGTELKLKGRPGRYRFLKKVTTPAGVTWIDVVGGRNAQYKQLASVREDAVQTVHRLARTRENANR